MKYKVDGILLVEGSGDSSFLSSFLETEIFITNGYEIPEKTIMFLKQASNKKKIILLTDPDEAGKEIRSKVQKQLSVYDVYVDIKKCNKKGKHGVAECTKDEILEKLKPFLKEKENNESKKKIQSSFLYINDLNNDNFYLFLEKKYSIYKSNIKQIIRMMNILELDEIKVLNEYKEWLNGN